MTPYCSHQDWRVCCVSGKSHEKEAAGKCPESECNCLALSDPTCKVTLQMRWLYTEVPLCSILLTDFVSFAVNSPDTGWFVDGIWNSKPHDTHSFYITPNVVLSYQYRKPTYTKLCVVDISPEELPAIKSISKMTIIIPLALCVRTL